MPSDRSVAMRVASPAEKAGRWLRRLKPTAFLLLFGITLWSLIPVRTIGPHVEEPVGGEARRLESAQERLRMASSFAAEDPQRAEFFVRHAIDLLQTLESPPPLLLAAALEELGTLLARNGESESAYWMFEESKALRSGLPVERGSPPWTLSQRPSDLGTPLEGTSRARETKDSQ